MTTGTHYPVPQFPVNPTTVVQPGCSDGQNRLALRPLQVSAESLTLLPVTRGAPLLACWAELTEYGVDLPPDLIPVYLDEIHASPALRDLSARNQRDGKGWSERYRKFMRFEPTVAQASPAARAAARQPVGHGLELVVQGDQPVVPGVPFQVRLLRDGQPLAGLPIQLVDQRGQGEWASTDAQGLLGTVVPAAGAWMLRGVDLRPTPDRRWESRFVTLVLEVR
ncbi:MAG: DUF4198 domain-containing protein [Comamonadaceae bacterium]|nr:MAG: DUF4198 domain-containing protein [Comamonadaceae bacterium]